MDCPSCRSCDIGTKDSRMRSNIRAIGYNGLAKYRKRFCKKCGHQWKTYELQEDKLLEATERRAKDRAVSIVAQAINYLTKED